MLAGHGDTLTAVQRLEGNAEAVFENTGLNRLNAADLKRDREDVQRQFDTMGAAMSLNQTNLHIDAKAAFAETSYLNQPSARLPGFAARDKTMLRIKLECVTKR